jgi:hypothetical protein
MMVEMIDFRILGGACAPAGQLRLETIFTERCLTCH